MTCEALGKTGKDGETCSEDEEIVDGKLSNLSVVGVQSPKLKTWNFD